MNADMFLDRQGYIELAEAIAARDADAAHRLGYALLSQLVDLFEADAQR